MSMCKVLAYWKIGHGRFSLVYAELHFPGIVFTPPNCVARTIDYTRHAHNGIPPTRYSYGFV